MKTLPEIAGQSEEILIQKSQIGPDQVRVKGNWRELRRTQSG